MGDNWYISRDGQRFGPYAFEFLQQMVQNHQLLRTDLVWSEKTGAWIKAAKVEGLFAPVPSVKEETGQLGRSPNRRKGPLKKVLAIAAAVAAVLAVLLTILPDKSSLDDEMKRLDVDAYFAVKFYELASLQTARVLNTRPQDVSYDTWKAGLEEAIALWEEAEKSAEDLDATADRVMDKAEKEEKKAAFFTPGPMPVYAYTSEEILAIYDAGPKGQRLKNLARQMGVSVQRARAELKVANGQIEAKSWDNYGDVAQKLENRAIAIKDTSKVLVYTGGVILTGGTASAFQTAGMVINGADIVLEVGADFSAIAIGNEEGAALLNDIRKITEPAAAIMGIADLAKMKETIGKIARYKDLLKNIDKVDNLKSAQALKAVFANKLDLSRLDFTNQGCYIVDQLNSYFSYTDEELVKDQKILGLNVADTKERIQEIIDGRVQPEAKIMTVDEAKRMGFDPEVKAEEVVLTLTEPEKKTEVDQKQTDQKPSTPATEEKPPENEPANSGQVKTPADMVGSWLSIGSRDSGGTLHLAGDDQIGVMIWTFTADGRCERKTGDRVGFVGTYHFENGTCYADIAHAYDPDNTTRIQLEIKDGVLFHGNLAFKKE